MKVAEVSKRYDISSDTLRYYERVGLIPPVNLEKRSWKNSARFLLPELQKCKKHLNYFTGAVRIDPLFTAPDLARVNVASVTFEPGARTAWHSYPLGQTLNVTAGCGRVQNWDGSIMEIRTGDVVWAPPGEKHWHGAAPTTAMTHISIVEQADGKSADWMEKVSDEEYQGGSSAE